MTAETPDAQMLATLEEACTNPPTLDDLLAVIQTWDGAVKRLVPYFAGSPCQIVSVDVYVSQDSAPWTWHRRNGAWCPADETDTCLRGN